MPLVSDCTAEVDCKIVRGDPFARTVILTRGYEDVHDDPEGYAVRMVFRKLQRDDMAPLLTLTASLELDAPARAAAELVATPAETQALPAYDIVAYTELVKLADDAPRRLFNSTVRIVD